MMVDDTTATATPPEEAVEQQPDKLANEKAFIETLSKLDNGQKAALRRNAGNTLAEARNVNWFYGISSRFAREWDEEAYFLVATLFAFDKTGGGQAGNFGDTVRKLRTNDSTDRRFNILLDADFDPRTGGELSYRLRQMVKWVLSKKDLNSRINWPQLLFDLKRWNHERKYIQKQWARRYYAPDAPQTESES